MLRHSLDDTVLSGFVLLLTGRSKGNASLCAEVVLKLGRQPHTGLYVKTVLYILKGHFDGDDASLNMNPKQTGISCEAGSCC